MGTLHRFNEDNSKDTSLKLDESTSMGDESKKIPIVSETELLITEEPEEETNLDNLNFWRKLVIVISLISAVGNVAIGVIEIGIAHKENSTAAFSLALTAAFDALTSALICWRFCRASDVLSHKKEHIGNIIFGLLVLCISIVIVAKSTMELIQRKTSNTSEENFNVVVGTSAISATMCFVIGALELVIAKKLSSWLIFSGAMESFVGAIVSLSLILEATLTRRNSSLWFIDSTVGLVTSVFFSFYGIWLAVNNIKALSRMKDYKETT